MHRRSAIPANRDSDDERARRSRLCGRFSRSANLLRPTGVQYRVSRRSVPHRPPFSGRIRTERSHRGSLRLLHRDGQASLRRIVGRRPRGAATRGTVGRPRVGVLRLPDRGRRSGGRRRPPRRCRHLSRRLPRPPRTRDSNRPAALAPPRARPRVARDGAGRRMLRFRRHVFGEVRGTLRRHGPSETRRRPALGSQYGNLARSQLPHANPGRRLPRRHEHPHAASGRSPCQPIAMPSDFQQHIHEALADSRLQEAIYTATGRLKDARLAVVADRVLPEYQELRAQANALKQHTIDHLDYYLEQFERNVEARGGRVVFCRDSAEVADFVLSLAKQRGARLIVKSKSMTTEEIDLNERLEHHGLESVETDLGEYLLQLAHERPYHIVAPALHKTRYDVAEILTKRLNAPHDTVPEKQTKLARAVLREKFLAADIGISGANFLVADSGAVVLVENDGNARLTTTAPKIHIAVAGIEKVIPRAQDLAVFLKLLARSATGQLLSVYTSFLSGPRRPGEIDGPDEFHVVLLDAGRTKLLADAEKRQSLYCIRCGACLNHCPVYRKIGGHSFPWVYSGPIGAIITPQFHGVESEPGLPFASSLCGACAEVCPVKIDIPKILLELRAEVKAEEKHHAANQTERMVFRTFAYAASRPKLWQRATRLAARFGPRGQGFVKKVPGFMNVGPVRAWLSQRDLPAPAEKSFREMWKERQGR